jgi:ribonuclease T1
MKRSMTGRLWAACLVLLLAGQISALGQKTDSTTPQEALAAFASQQGLHDVRSFVEAVLSLRTTGRLPPRYVTKDQARAQGWHGGGLCSVWPGHVIGGDTFNNFNGALPEGDYIEADLDSSCRSRGGKRLVYSSDQGIYVTVDHYNSFNAAP